MGGTRLLDHRPVDVDTDRPTRSTDGLGDPPCDGAGTAPDVENREAGAQQRCETPVVRHERARVEDRARAFGHVRPLSGGVWRYHGASGDPGWRVSTNTRGALARNGSRGSRGRPRSWPPRGAGRTPALSFAAPRPRAAPPT